MNPDQSPILRALQYFRAYRKRQIGLAVLSTISAFLEAVGYALVVPLVAAAVAGEQSYSFTLFDTTHEVGIGWIFAAAITAIVTRAGLVLLTSYLYAVMVGEYTSRQQRRAARAILRARWSTQAEVRDAEMQNALSSYLDRARVGLNNLSAAMGALASFLIFLTGAVLIGGPVAFAILGLIGILFFALRPLANRARETSADLADALPRYAGTLSESVRMAREIRLFGARDPVIARFDAIVDRLRRLTIVQRVLASATSAVYQAVGLLLLIAGIGFVMVSDIGRIDALAAAGILMLKSLQYGRLLQIEYHSCHDFLPFAEKLEDSLRTLEAAAEVDHGDPVVQIGRIELDDVHFDYGTDGPVLQDVSFALERGDSVGIIGPSGAGKSTLLQLLLRLREPTSGRVLANGRPASAISRASWYERVAFVPQEDHLFADTVLQNIRAYRADVSAEQARQAARLAHVAAEIEAMADGFDTDVGERGGRLSGGQRQRVCIARALAGSPDILIFDEPTSALDAHSDAALQETLRELRGQTTLVIVAHRLSTLAVCDKIMVLRDGRIQAFGPRDTIQDDGGYFKDVLRLAGMH